MEVTPTVQFARIKVVLLPYMLLTAHTPVSHTKTGQKEDFSSETVSEG